MKLYSPRRAKEQLSLDQADEDLIDVEEPKKKSGWFRRSSGSTKAEKETKDDSVTEEAIKDTPKKKKFFGRSKKEKVEKDIADDLFENDNGEAEENKPKKKSGFFRSKKDKAEEERGDNEEECEELLSPGKPRKFGFRSKKGSKKSEDEREDSIDKDIEATEAPTPTKKKKFSPFSSKKKILDDDIMEEDNDGVRGSKNKEKEDTSEQTEITEEKKPKKFFSFGKKNAEKEVESPEEETEQLADIDAETKSTESLEPKSDTIKELPEKVEREEVPIPLPAPADTPRSYAEENTLPHDSIRSPDKCEIYKPIEATPPVKAAPSIDDDSVEDVTPSAPVEKESLENTSITINKEEVAASEPEEKSRNYEMESVQEKKKEDIVEDEEQQPSILDKFMKPCSKDNLSFSNKKLNCDSTNPGLFCGLFSNN